MKQLIIFLIILCVGCTVAPQSESLTMETALAQAGTKVALEESAKATILAQIELTQIADIPTIEPTLEPTLEPTQSPQPIIFNGNTANVFPLSKWQGPAIVHMKYDGNANFIADALDSNNNRTTLMGLANEIGSFEAWRLIDTENTQTVRLQIEMASGPYTLEVFPISSEYIRTVNVPGQYKGQGPDLILLKGAEPDLISLVFSGKGNFIVESLDKNLQRNSLMGLVNEIDTYEGTKVLAAGTRYIYIPYGNGDYVFNVTGK